ncbi:MAG: restriction endonuclease subunit S [Glaciecola sp.]|nr:restriction endonuclease subunit S [Glaciecola sp.]
MNQGWVSKKLKDCFKLKSGDGLTAKNMIPGDYPVFGGNSQTGTHNTFNLSGDNIIIGRVGALCGNARHITENIWLTDNAFKIMDKKYEFDNNFLTYLLNYNNLRSFARQAAQPVISNSSLKDLELDFPTDVEEQKRIVAILDQAFADLEQVRAKTEQNLKNARELFDSYLQQVFSQKGDGWLESTLDDSCNLITCGVAATPKYVDKEEGIAFLSAQNVKKSKIDLSKYRYISKEHHAHLTKNNKPQNGDLLYSRVGAGFGEAAVIELDFEFSVYVSVTLIKPIKEKLNSHFLKWFLNSPETKAVAKASISSSGVPNLNVKSVRAFFIAYPSLAEQEKIVNQIDLVNDLNLKVQDIYTKKLEAIGVLKKSILQKAFSGELTLQQTNS